MDASLLDTDTLSEIIKARNRSVIDHAAAYLVEHGAFTFSLITRYEILRGLKAKGAKVQEAAFNKRCQVSIVLDLTDRIVTRAASIYADLKIAGALISDADILIAATAIDHDLILVTNNVRHFSRIFGLKTDSWSR